MTDATRRRPRRARGSRCCARAPGEAGPYRPPADGRPDPPGQRDARRHAGEIAKRTGMAKRTVYRDLNAIGGELGIPVWSEGGRWGVDDEAFLPPLRLTLSEAMAIFLSARLLARYMDKHDPVLASAFTKLEEGLPASLRDHVERTVQDLARRDVDPAFNRHVEDLTRAWADRRVVAFEYLPAPYGAKRDPRRATVRPYLLEPSLQTHALYLIGFDEDRGAMRTFKVERIRDLSVLPRTFEAPEDDVVVAAAAGVGHHRGPARHRGGAALPPTVAGARDGGDVAPEPARRRSSRTGRSSGARRSRAPSRSGSGSCPGAATWRCWRRRRCGRTWRDAPAARPPSTGRLTAGHSARDLRAGRGTPAPSVGCACPRARQPPPGAPMPS